MRGFLSLLIAISLCICTAASSSDAQEQVSAFAFAPSKHLIVDKKSSGLSKITDSLNDSLEPLRGEQGKNLMVGCVGLSLLTLVLGMPFAALAAGGIAILLMLLNKPLLLVGALVGAVLLRTQLYVLLLSPKGSDEPHAGANAEPPTAKKGSAPAAGSNPSEHKPSAPAMPKLARPL